MAVTDFRKKYHVNNAEYAYTLVDHDVVEAGSSIPLYVPALMPKIKTGSPKIQKKTSKGNLVFKNDTRSNSRCKPSAKKIIQSQNYISPPFSRNQTWKGISKTVTKNEEEIEYIPRKSQVLCTSINGTTKKMNFGTDQVQ